MPGCLRIFPAIQNWLWGNLCPYPTLQFTMYAISYSSRQRLAYTSNGCCQCIPSRRARRRNLYGTPWGFTLWLIKFKTNCLSTGKGLIWPETIWAGLEYYLSDYSNVSRICEAFRRQFCFSEQKFRGNYCPICWQFAHIFKRNKAAARLENEAPKGQ